MRMKEARQKEWALGFHLDKTFKMENIIYFIYLFFEKGGENEEREVLHREAVMRKHLWIMNITILLIMLMLSLVYTCVHMLKRIKSYTLNIYCLLYIVSQWYNILQSCRRNGDVPGGTVVKNPPASAGDTGSIPGLGKSHMPQSN